MIKKAWWYRWWAYLLYATFLGFVIYNSYRFLLSRKLAIEESKRQKQINELKNNLYTNISHEFRTPLTVILGMTDSLVNELKETPDVKNTLEMIRRNSQNLLTLVNEMLELSKLESGHVQVEYVQIDVVLLIKYLGESFSSYASKKNIQFKVHSEIDELVMDVDTEKLSAIISNLLSNAIKFTPPYGNIELHFKCQHDGFLEINVRDSGVGILKEDLPHIFDRFYQADTSFAKKAEGTGIGLALTKDLLTELGGQISVTSTPGKGSVFTVLIPITHNAPTNELNYPDLNMEKLSNIPVGHVKENAINSESHDLPLILLIEDHKDVAQYITQCLSGSYKTLVAASGDEGLELAFAHLPDIVITDVMMPGKDGYEVCKTLKEDELTNHIPIIMLTAKATTEDRLHGLSHGADAYLSKPFLREELLTRIEQLILVRQNLIRKFEYSGFGQLNQGRRKDPETGFIQKAVICIQENMSDESFGPTELASGLFLSESQLYRKLKGISGKSTAVFIRYVRLQEANKLLKTTDLTVSEIAYEVGFSNLSWFSRIFKEELGSPPTAVRK